MHAQHYQENGIKSEKNKQNPIITLQLDFSAFRWRGTGIHAAFFWGLSLFSIWMVITCPWVSLPISFLSPLPLTISPTPTAAARREKESHKIFTSHPALINVKGISFPSYKADKIKVSEMNKLKLPFFCIFFPPNIRTIVTYMT